MGILLNKSKNYIINGALDYWQRGTSFAAIANSVYMTDRFVYRKTGTMVHTVSQDLADKPTLAQSGSIFPASLKHLLTTPQPVLAAGDFNHIAQRIEGQVIAPLQGKNIAVSFWVKATLAGTYAVAIKNSALDRSYVSTYTVNATETWEKKTITFAFDSSGIWLADTGIGMRLIFSVASGATRRVSTLNTWVSGDFESHASCVNGVNTGATNFRIAGIQLEEGTTASGFERAGENAPNELLLCQRYYETGFHSLGAVGLVSGVVGSFGIAQFKTTKRGTPSIGIFNGANINQTRNDNTGASEGAMAVGSSFTTGFGARSTTALSAGVQYSFGWTADSEL